MCFKIDNLNLRSAVVLAAPNLFTIEIKERRSLMNARSANNEDSTNPLFVMLNFAQDVKFSVFHSSLFVQLKKL